MWGSSTGITRSSSESIRRSHVLPLRDEPKIHDNRPGAVTEMSGLTPSFTLPLRSERSDASRAAPSPLCQTEGLDAAASQARQDQQDETDHDAQDSQWVIDQYGEHDPDHDE